MITRYLSHLRFCVLLGCVLALNACTEEADGPEPVSVLDCSEGEAVTHADRPYCVYERGGGGDEPPAECPDGYEHRHEFDEAVVCSVREEVPGELADEYRASETCGDGELDDDETCDPAIAAGEPGACPETCGAADACTEATLFGEASSCTARCEAAPIEACETGDGCCPDRCSFNLDEDCPEPDMDRCGNGELNSGEQCDPAIAAGEDGACPTAQTCTPPDACSEVTLSGNASSCSARCEIESIEVCQTGDGCCPSGCTFDEDEDCPEPELCGNGALDDGEACDPEIEPGQDGACPTECDDADVCTTDSLVGEADECTAECTHVQQSGCTSCELEEWFMGTYETTSEDCEDGQICQVGQCQDEPEWEIVHWRNEFPLNDMWGASSDDIWGAYGEEFVHWDGDRWTPTPAPSGTTSAAPTAFWGDHTSGELWAIGGQLIFYLDNGQWTVAHEATRHTRSIWGAAHDDIWVGTNEGDFLHWDGQNWSDVSLPAPGGNAEYRDVTAIWGSSATDVWATVEYIGSYSVSLMHYDGQDWSEWPYFEPDESFDHIWGSGPDDVWACAWQHRMYRYDGQGWVEDTSSQGCTEIYEDASGVGWMVTNGELHTYTGEDWQSVDTPDTGSRQVWASSGSDIWWVGDEMHHYDGQSWTRVIETPTLADLELVWGGGPNNIWAFGSQVALHYDGAEWTELEEFSVNYPIEVWGTAADDFYLLAIDEVYHYDGVEFTQESLPAAADDADLQTIWGSGPDDIWVGGSTGRDYNQEIFMLHNDGSGWSEYPYVQADRLNAITSIWGSGPGDVWAAGGNYELLHYDGQGWQDIYNGNLTATKLWGTADDDVWAFEGGQEEPWRWDGTDWQRINQRMRTLQGIWGSGPDNIWGVVTADFASSDRHFAWYTDGEWLTFPAPRNVRLFDVWGSGPNDVWAVGEDGAILRLQ